jgi:hypothetical protein
MSPQECYSKFLIKINRNNTGANRTCDKGRFITIFNEQKNRWVDQQLKNKNSILIDSIQELVKSVSIVSPTVYDEYSDFSFTNEFYEFIDAKCLAKKGNCKRTIRLREIKNPNKQIVYFDEFNKPSFEWEWSFLTIQNNKLRVYKTDFEILKVDVEYFKLIPPLDIEGYIKIDGTASTNAPIILSEQYVDQIISRAAEEFMRNYENQLGVALAKDRINSES